jgi:aminopeptidase N
LRPRTDGRRAGASGGWATAATTSGTTGWTPPTTRRPTSWTERHGGQSAQQSFQQTYDDPPAVPPDRPPFWELVVADPTRDQMFHGAVYSRGGLTLQALRQKIGDGRFLRLARTWAQQKRYSTATTEEFVSLAEKVSGRELDDFFRVWLYTPSKPTSW